MRGNIFQQTTIRTLRIPLIATAAPGRFFSMGASQSSTISGPLKEEVDGLIKNKQVMVFSKSYCPYCDETKRTLSKINADVHIMELDQEAHGSDIQSYLATVSGQRTVPNVFINGQHLGGNSDVQAASRNGQLSTMLKSNL
eukprot:Clim_evm23s77 gene=Clim_evmTU23s77